MYASLVTVLPTRLHDYADVQRASGDSLATPFLACLSASAAPSLVRARHHGRIGKLPAALRRASSAARHSDVACGRPLRDCVLVDSCSNDDIKRPWFPLLASAWRRRLALAVFPSSFPTSRSNHHVFVCVTLEATARKPSEANMFVQRRQHQQGSGPWLASCSCTMRERRTAQLYPI